MSQRMRNTYRALKSVVALAALMVAVPIGLAAASVRRFGTANPLHGVTAPWRWIAAGLSGLRHDLGHVVFRRTPTAGGNDDCRRVTGIGGR